MNSQLTLYQPHNRKLPRRTTDPRIVASSPEPVSIPADHEDPNHPHYPGDLEHQSGSRRFVITTKRVIIAAGVVTTILFIIAAAI